MFCTTECWSCEDKTCEHYISKEELYFKNQQLKDRINKAIEYIENNAKPYAFSNKMLKEECILKLLKILKGGENND